MSEEKCCFNSSQFYFVLIYEKGEDYNEAIDVFKPKEVIQFDNRVILVLETKRDVMLKKGIFVADAFIDRARFLVEMPNPIYENEDGCKVVVKFPKIVDKKTNKLLPIEHGGLIRDYVMLNHQLGNEVEAYFISIKAKKLDKGGLKIDQEVKVCTTEVTDESDDGQKGGLVYWLRCPNAKDFDLKANQFIDEAMKLVNVDRN